MTVPTKNSCWEIFCCYCCIPVDNQVKSISETDRKITVLQSAIGNNPRHHYLASTDVLSGNEVLKMTDLEYEAYQKRNQKKDGK